MSDLFAIPVELTNLSAVFDWDVFVQHQGVQGIFCLCKSRSTATVLDTLASGDCSVDYFQNLVAFAVGCCHN